MTDKILPPRGNSNQYRQVYYKNNRLKPYTSAQMNRDDYCQTEVWRELRYKRLQLDHYRCAQCGTAINVQVHHIRYPDVWGMESVEDDLITLCAECHAETHKYDIEKWNEASRVMPEEPVPF